MGGTPIASSYTTRLRLELQGDGENDDTWGDKANGVFTLLDEAIDGYLAVDVAGSSNVTLTTSNSTSDQSRQRVLKFTGTLTGDIDVIAPAVEKHYVVWNATSGAFAITFKPSGGTGVVVPQGYLGPVFTDVSTMYQAATWIAASGGGKDGTLNAPVATTSGTTVDITSLNGAIIKRITLFLDGVSGNGTDTLRLRLGDSGGVESTGYYVGISAVERPDTPSIDGGGDVGQVNLGSAGDAGDTFYGVITLTRLSTTAQRWAVEVNLFTIETGFALADRTFNGAAVKTVSGTLDRLQLLWSGSNTFDAGAVSILVENF